MAAVQEGCPREADVAAGSSAARNAAGPISGTEQPQQNGALGRCLTIADIQALAARRLPKPVRDYLEGGAGDERTLARNRRAFDTVGLVPHLLNDVGHVDLGTTVLGAPSSAPLICAPTGFTRLFHSIGERTVQQAAAAEGVPYTLSAFGSTTIEDVAHAAPVPFFFQIYVFRDPGLNAEIIARAKEAGVRALMLTIDVPVVGRRERDLRNGMTFPPRLSPGFLFEFARHPGWLAGYLFGRKATIANVAHKAKGLAGTTAFIGAQLTPAVTWDDAARMIEAWDGPFAIKGILAPEDAERARGAGASAVVVSNHGGRQLDGAAAPLDMLPEIAGAVSGDLEILMDGGIRRGSDVLKALALGATACAVGRPYLYGLAAAGQDGVRRVLALLKEEMARDLALLGCTSPGQVTRAHIRRLSGR